MVPPRTALCTCWKTLSTPEYANVSTDSTDFVESGGTLLVFISREEKAAQI